MVDYAGVKEPTLSIRGRLSDGLQPCCERRLLLEWSTLLNVCFTVYYIENMVQKRCEHLDGSDDSKGGEHLDVSKRRHRPQSNECALP